MSKEQGDRGRHSLPARLPELNEAARRIIYGIFGEPDPEPLTSEDVVDRHFSKPSREEPLSDEELDQDLFEGRYQVPITLRAHPWLRTIIRRR